MVEAMGTSRKHGNRAVLLVALAVSFASAHIAETLSAFSATTANSSNSFAAAANFCSESSAISVTGIESGVVSASGTGLWNTIVTTGGTPAANSTTPRNGTYSLRINKSSAGESSVTDTLASTQNVLVMRFAVRFATLPSASVRVMSIEVTAGSSLALFYVSSTQKLQMRFQSGTGTSSSSTIASGTWYLIDVRATFNANPRTADWQVAGVTQTQESYAETASTASSVLWGSTGASHVFDAYYDDILVSSDSTAYPLGDGKVQALLPTANGTHSTSGNYQDDDSSAIDSTSYGRTDEIPLAGGTDYVKQVTAGSTSYLEFTVADTTETCINAVSGYLGYRSASTTSNNGKTSVFEGSNENVVYSGDMSETSTFYKSGVVTPPTAGWTTSDVNGLKFRVGYSSDVDAVPYWYGLMLEYDSEVVTSSCGASVGSVVMLTGWEHGNHQIAGGTAFFDDDQGTVTTIDSSVKRNGGYSLKITKAVGADGEVIRNITAVNGLVSRVAIRLESLPLTDLELVEFKGTDSENMLLYHKASDDKMYLGFGGGDQAGPTMVAGTWYVVDIRSTWNANPHTADWQVDGTAYTQATVTAASAQVNSIELGDGATADLGTINYDDMLVSSDTTTYPIGDGAVVGLSPNARGTTNDSSGEIQNDSGTDFQNDSSIWNRVDDIPMSSTTDYIQQVTTGTTLYGELLMTNSATACPRAVSGIAHLGSTSSTANNAKVYVYESSNQNTIYNGSTGTGSWKSAAVTAPTGGWTDTDIDALAFRVGYSSDVSPVPYWYSLLLEVESEA